MGLQGGPVLALHDKMDDAELERLLRLPLTSSEVAKAQPQWHRHLLRMEMQRKDVVIQSLSDFTLPPHVTG
jgi:hypothetical protein